MANDKRKNGLAAEDVAAQVGKKSKKVKKDQWAKAEEAAPPEEDSKKGKKDKTKHKKGEAAQEAPKSDKKHKKKDKITKRTEVEEEEAEAQEAPAAKHKKNQNSGYMEEEELENSPSRGAREAIQQPGKKHKQKDKQHAEVEEEAAEAPAAKHKKNQNSGFMEEEEAEEEELENSPARGAQEAIQQPGKVVTAGKASKRVKAEESLSFLQTELKLAKKDLEVLAAKKDQELANFGGLVEFVEAECMPKAYKGLQRAEKWRAYFKKNENLAQCAAHHGFSNPGAEIVTIFRDLSDDIHNLNATRFMTRFKTELLRFGPPLSLRQAELLVCIATHLGFRSEAHGVLEKTVSP
ncbi:hypothetical protein CHLRE_15g640502v5 [Chlamydomonas reinhardtii]|uniref:Uncharacterized protein n=1 Tax=Chlamydomonas reinhardtii TaxID=3055 RepID=A0A2K3CWL7_CHLRE|nr:uncharacterized protein CHLRE_15g640502v5 [Chlamydomonas reinhardtii]PNW72676.1 hypothetical protein CHLRE_15g640502v5 [Chlamydomonas reinhardtii]